MTSSHVDAHDLVSDPESRFKPSTRRRRANLRLIIERFALQAFDAAAVASLAQCSMGAAYDYLDLLAEASVIKYVHSNADGGTTGRAYRLNEDPRYAERFLAELDEVPVLRRAGKRQVIWRDHNGRLRGKLASDPTPEELARPVVQRDPLVAALFGNSCVGAQLDGMHDHLGLN